MNVCFGRGDAGERIAEVMLVDIRFSMKIPRDLTEASLSGAGLSIIAALSMLFLFGM
ncbi:hypothetical protein CICLE_v10023294mg, partial [Citrus x clementina]